MVPVNEIGAFALATLGESINPGPTLAALVSARTRGRQESWGVVLGVALANIAWVIIVVLLRLFASRLPPWPEAEPLLKAIAALILVFIATRASVGPWSLEQNRTFSKIGASQWRPLQRAARNRSLAP
jgi:threonine/homoserine/homoserine lactone efflux protein